MEYHSGEDYSYCIVRIDGLDVDRGSSKPPSPIIVIGILDRLSYDRYRIAQRT